MLTSMLSATAVILAIVAALTACTTATPTLGPTESPTPRDVAATPALLPDTPEPEATVTPTSSPEPMTTVIPTTAPGATPASTPSPQPTVTFGPTPTPGAPKALAPLPIHDHQALLADLSQAELRCFDVHEKLTRTLASPGTAPKEEQALFIDCLEDETIARLFLAGFVPRTEPLSLESSTCVRAAFEVIEPRKVMTAGLEGDPASAMAGTMAALPVTIACLNDEEWEAAAPGLGMRPEERAGMRCLMRELGGPREMAGVMRVAQAGHFTPLSSAAAECGLEIGPKSEGEPVIPRPPPTATPEAPVTPPATTLTIIVAEVPADIPEYDRSEWRHWTDEDGDCQDARQEVLIEESLAEVTFQTDRKCRVATGRWYGAYTGTFVEDPGALDVDHVVPLKNAHRSGGWRWPPEKKAEYANDLSDPEHLIAVTAGANRSKGAKGPEEWAPPDSDYWCEYATDWTDIKERWLLTMTPRESEIVMDMLYTCEEPPEVEVLTGMIVVTGVDKPTPEPEEPVYESCEEAEAAGEELVKGSQGGGRGFPKAMVPSARDGDGDGVVCEN